MSLNFPEVFTAFTTTRYNKAALINCIICLIICVVIIGISNNIIIGILISMFVYLLISGYLVLMSHNEAVRSNNVVPEISDMGKILNIGFKYLTGISTLMVIFCFPALLYLAFLIASVINMAFSQGTSSLGSLAVTPLLMIFGIFIFGIIAIILSFKYAIPAQLLYMQTLNLSDMFSYKKITKYGNMISKDYWIYISYMILISMIINMVVQTIMSIFMGIYSISNIMTSVNGQIDTTMDLLQYFKENTGLIMGSLVLSTVLQSICFILFMPNLNGQVIRNVLSRELKK